MVWEGGLDKRSSLDSIQQALFFSILTGKEPGVVINKPERDAAIGAMCARKGFEGRWTVDLAQDRHKSGQRPVQL